MYLQRFSKQLRITEKSSLLSSKCFCTSPLFSQDHHHKQQEKINKIPNESTADFGFETVTASEKARKVYNVFEGVASSYDVMNDMMSVGIHRLWKDYFVSRLSPVRPGSRILDVAGGTGDIAFRIVKQIEYQNSAATETSTTLSSTVVVSDINQAMLDVGKKRSLDLDPNLQDRLTWLCADAQDLPLEDNSFDLYTIAFGIRNVVDIQKALDEAYRVLKPGGRFMCLEFSHVENPVIKWVYDRYSFQVIPPMGELIAGDWKSYQYLVESIRKFPTQDNFKLMIEEAGFRCTSYQNLTYGVVAIHSGFKI